MLAVGVWAVCIRKLAASLWFAQRLSEVLSNW